MLARVIREYSKTNRACFVSCFSRIASWLMDNSLACKPDCRVSEIISSESQQRFNYLSDDSLFESIITILVAFFLSAATLVDERGYSSVLHSPAGISQTVKKVIGRIHFSVSQHYALPTRRRSKPKTQRQRPKPPNTNLKPSKGQVYNGTFSFLFTGITPWWSTQRVATEHFITAFTG